MVIFGYYAWMLYSDTLLKRHYAKTTLLTGCMGYVKLTIYTCIATQVDIALLSLIDVKATRLHAPFTVSLPTHLSYIPALE